MFRTVRLSIIRSLFTAHSAMVYVIQVCGQLSSRSICSCSKAEFVRLYIFNPTSFIILKNFNIIFYLISKQNFFLFLLFLNAVYVTAFFSLYNSGWNKILTHTHINFYILTMRASNISKSLLSYIYTTVLDRLATTPLRQPIKFDFSHFLRCLYSVHCTHCLDTHNDHDLDVVRPVFIVLCLVETV
jgi:hypothetical protein